MSFSGLKPAAPELTGLQSFDGGLGPDTETGDTDAAFFDKTATNIGVLDSALALLVVAQWKRTHLAVDTDGQTIFALPAAPTQPQDTQLIINGLSYHAPTHLSGTGSSLAWLDTEFTLETTDHIFANWR